MERDKRSNERQAKAKPASKNVSLFPVPHLQPVKTKSKKKRIGYVLRRFPSLSETFILNEILAMEALDAKIEIYSIMQPRDTKFHEGITRLKSNIRYVPTLGDLKSLFKYNRRALKSFGSAYVKTGLLCALTFNPLQIWRFFQAGYIAERAREKKVDCLHAHFGNRAANVARMVSRISGLPYSFTAHAVDIYKNTVRPRILKERIRKAEFVVTVSDRNKRFLEKLVPEARDKIIRIYNGVDFDHFKPGKDKKEGPFNILCVGRMVEKKGLEYLIEACAYLKDQGHDFHCNIIGKGSLRPKLNEMIKALDLKDHVKMVGVVTQDKMPAWFRKADAFVLPSIVADDGNREGLPVSIVEALASGLPVVSTDVAGITEAVMQDWNGFVVPERDSLAVAAAVSRMIRDRALHQRLSSNARLSVENRFDQELTSKALWRLLTRRTTPSAAEAKQIEPVKREKLRLEEVH